MIYINGIYEFEKTFNSSSSFSSIQRTAVKAIRMPRVYLAALSLCHHWAKADLIGFSCCHAIVHPRAAAERHVWIVALPEPKSDYL